MPANLQIDSSSKGIEQLDGMPATFLQLFYVFVFCWTLEATLGTTLGPLFAVFSTIWARLSGILWFWCPCVAQGANHVKMVRPRGPHLKSNLSDFLQNCMFLLKCFLKMVFLSFLGARKGRQKGFRSRGSMFFTFAPILKKTWKGDNFGTLFESICRLKSFMGRYRKTRTKTRDMDTPPPDNGTFQVLPGCQATPARWHHLERKSKGREQKTYHLGPHPGLKSSTSDFQSENYPEAHLLKGGLYIYIFTSLYTYT